MPLYSLPPFWYKPHGRTGKSTRRRIGTEKIMDETRNLGEAAGLSLQGPHWHREAEAGVDSQPLRLVLQPSGLQIELTGPEMLLGRHSSADIRLPLPDVSRRHCRFVFLDGRWQVFDLNSLNGVFVNDQPVAQAT